MLMQPNSPSPAPPPIQPGLGGPSQYDFITAPKKLPKKGLLPSGGSKKGRIFLVGGGLLGLIIIVFIGLAIFNSIGNAAKQDWLTLAQKQQELIRISEIGADKAQNRDTKNLATTTNLALKSSQATVNSLAKKNGAVVNSKSLALGKSAKTDAALKTAEQTNQFDASFQVILKAELNEYQALLKKLHEGTNSKSTKSGLTNAYTNAGLLAAQANQ